MLDARGAIRVTERQRYILRTLARTLAEAYLAKRSASRYSYKLNKAAE